MSPRTCLSVCLAASVALTSLLLGGPASAVTAPVGLGTAGSYAVLAGTAVTNTGPSVINGDLGVAPGTALSGFPPGTLNGVQHLGDAVALTAKDDLGTAYVDAAGRARDVDETGVDLGGLTLVPGVYRADADMALTGTVTLDAGGDPDAIFLFQAGSALTTATGSSVSLVGGAQACHVYWKIGSSATIGTSTSFVGTILALTSATLQTGATLQGRVLARNGAVTLDTNTITRPTCAAGPVVPPATATATSAPATAAPTTPPSAGASSTATAKPSSKPSTKPSATAGSNGSNGSGGTSGSAGGTSSGSDGSTSSDGGSDTADGGPVTGDVVPSGRPDTGRPVAAAQVETGGVPGLLWAAAALLLAGAGAVVTIGARAMPAGRRRR